ncbi:MAG: energy-coupling factor transporter transmembrane protein EcfT [Clostridia bacterium]|nr:energy-coupling factor transporter transmembrane protein EcfT [Clostridia bacterium]
MISDVTLGQYYHKKSFIHSMDARVKIILMIGFIVVAFLANNVPSILLTVLSTLFFIALSRVPLRLYFKGLGAIWFIILFTAVLNCLYIPGRELFSIWKLTVTFEGIRQSCIVAARLVCLILISSILTFTTTPTQLTSAIESLLAPLKLFGVKVHDLAMMMTIALRFVPTLLEEAEKIMSAQKARGADLGSGGVISRIKAVVPILVPLIVSAFRRAYDLALAMECRCYTDGKGRTRLNPMKIRFRDVFGFIVAGALAAGIILLRDVPHWSVLLSQAEELIEKYI